VRLGAGLSTLFVLTGALVGMLVLGMTGAVTALGDTLFPAASLAEAEAQTFSNTAHLFIRLRLWHLAMAVAVGLGVGWMSFSGIATGPSGTTGKIARTLIALYFVQLMVGAMNVWLLAPIPAQITHLLLSDLIWIVLVLFEASILSAEPA
jgi:heme A synthase